MEKAWFPPALATNLSFTGALRNLGYHAHFTDATTTTVLTRHSLMRSSTTPTMHTGGEEKLEPFSLDPVIKAASCTRIS